MKKNIIILILILLIGLLFVIFPAFEKNKNDTHKIQYPNTHANKVTDNKTIDTIAFTSDVHNHSYTEIPEKNSGAYKLKSWIENVSKKENDLFEVMGTCGDNADYAASTPDIYWKQAKQVLDVIDNSPFIKDSTGAFIFGNHEYSPGNINIVGLNDVSKRYQQDVGVLKETNNFIIYGFGSFTSETNWFQYYQEDKIAKLKNYLKTAPTNKPIFIIAHFPLHKNPGGRNTPQKDEIISILNKAGQTRNIFFLWGHNHSSVDGKNELNYDKIFTTQIPSTDGNQNINFVYAAAGCGSDSEHNTASSNVAGKGIVASINKKSHDVTLKYYKKSPYEAFASTTIPAIH